MAYIQIRQNIPLFWGALRMTCAYHYPERYERGNAADGLSKRRENEKKITHAKHTQNTRKNTRKTREKREQQMTNRPGDGEQRLSDFAFVFWSFYCKCKCYWQTTYFY